MDAQQAEPEYLTVEEAAAYLRMNLKMFKLTLLRGEIPWRQVSARKRLFKRADLDDWAEKQKVTAWPEGAKPGRPKGSSGRHTKPKRKTA